MRKYQLTASRASRYNKTAADKLRQPLSFITKDMIAGVFDSQMSGRHDLTVCFTGHRTIPKSDLSLLPGRLDLLLNALYEHGYRDFISGAARGFDLLAAEAVLRLRIAHPDVRLLMALPCATQSQLWHDADLQRYEQILYNADAIKVLSEKYYHGCMLARNRYMVDQSAMCVCFLTHNRGGTIYTVSYAMKVDCPVINIAMADAVEAFVRST